MTSFLAVWIADSRARRWAQWLALLVVTVAAGSIAMGDSAVTASPQTGQIRVETDRYSARFDDGVLTYLYSKLGKIAFIGSDRPPTAMSNRTGLYVEDRPKADPFWLIPGRAGAERSVVTVQKASPLSVTVAYKGLARTGGDANSPKFRPTAVLQVTVSVDGNSGDMMVSTSGSTDSECLVGSGFAFTGIMPKYVLYAARGCGLRQESDPAKKLSPLDCTLEWGNYTMSKRPGLSGGLWNAPVTVIGSARQPRQVFGIWCEDDEPFYKFFAGSVDGVTYATYSHTPYAANRATQSVVWRINVYDGGWPQAARPFAESLPRRGFTRTRAPWAKDISVIVQVSDLDDRRLGALEDLFPPADRKHVLLYVQGWRKAGFDHNMWDYEPTDAFKDGAPKSRAAGFHTLAYMNPMICWGDATKIQDPNLQETVKQFKANGTLDPIDLKLVPYAVHLNLAYKPWREYLWAAAANLIHNCHIDGIYLDCTYQTLPDGRGNIDGMNAYQGMKEYLDGLRRIKPDLFIGTEMPNELIAWGADYGLHTGLEWNKGNEENKARKTHPIVNYLYQHVLTTMIHAHMPYLRPARIYHLNEEIAERSGQVAAMSVEPSMLPCTETPEVKLWKLKARLFAHRGLRPFFPTEWEPNVMSYLKAEDDTVFAYEETDYGSRLVERTKGGPVVHYARAWKTTSFKTNDGRILNWIGQADDGTYIGLDNVHGAYVLLPDAPADPRLRVAELPEATRITKYLLDDHIATLELASPNSVPRARIQLVFQRRPFRLAAPGKPDIPLDVNGRATVPANGPLSVIWTHGVIAPFEYAGRYLTPLPKDLVGEPNKPILLKIGGEWNPYLYRFVEKSDEWDQSWNCPLVGPHNPRPGTVYRFTFKARRPAGTAGKDVTAASCLSTWGTRTGELFDYAGGRQRLRADANEMVVTNAGVRNTEYKFGRERIMVLCASGSALLSDFSPIEFIRPELALSDSGRIDLGQVKPGERSAESPARQVINSQRLTARSGDRAFRTILYGVAHITAPQDKPFLQSIDDVGVELVGEQAALFELVSRNATSDGLGIKLIGEDGQSGLCGGEQPESESFTVRFRGSDKPGTYTAIVRIVTQAGNLGELSKGDKSQPPAGVYYCDIPVTVTVR